jgi:RsiW-degrading membrane proteinase PrsW (M82 family)
LNVDFILPSLLGLMPVLVFLAVLVWMDSYKLVRLRTVLLVIASGAAAAGMAWLIISQLLVPVMDPTPIRRLAAPLLEEALKAAIVVALIRTNRVGFLVDAAILGFAAGTGFALVENLYYLAEVDRAGLGLWIVRGLGTAIMHGGTTTIFAVTAKAIADETRHVGPGTFVPGLLLATLLHSFFNHFFVAPMLQTGLIMLALPPMVALVFRRSERSLRDWLDVGFDADTEMLELIRTGQLSNSKVGRYLTSLKDKFRGEVIADLLCYLRLHTELSLRAKGLLLMRESGFQIQVDQDIREKLEELAFLERSIGRTGRLAVMPVLLKTGKELWQIYMLKE